MSSALQSTEWPSTPEVASEVKELLAKFFSLVDDKDEDARRQLAEDVFFEDGEWKLPFVAFNGKSEIRDSRGGVWKGVTYRQHHIHKAFVGDTQGRDLLLLGKFTAGKEDGSKEASDFAGRMLVEWDMHGKPRVRVAQAWAFAAIKA